METYPDSAAFASANIPLGSLSISSIGSFSSSNTRWEATGSMHFTWSNDVTGAEAISVIDHAGTAFNLRSRESALRPVEYSSASGDTVLADTISTLNRTCGITGKHTISGTAAQIVTPPAGGSTTMWTFTRSQGGTDVDERVCAAPKAKLNLSYGTATGTELNLSLPQGQTASVSINANASAKGESGGSDISSYAWTIGSGSGGSAESFSSTFSSTAGVWLTVTDGDGATGSTSGQVSLSFLDPCDDPTTETVETDCSWRHNGDQVSSGGNTQDDGIPHGGSPGSHWVCYVTDWYQYQNGSWVYTDTTIDSCDLE